VSCVSFVVVLCALCRGCFVSCACGS
jgi:hypothetical protein